MRDEDDAMRALMGFASFGRPRKRVRRGAGGSASDRFEVHHVVPHTGVECDAERVPATRLRVREHGITMLLHPGKQQKTAEQLQHHGSSGERERSQQTESYAPDGAGWWSLPSRSQALLASVEATKSRFEQLEAHAFALARRRANPYEPLGRHRFINRSAMKMANLDFLFQWTQRVGDGENPFVFADVCGGPGGFSEYLLWRCKGEATTATKERPLAAVGFGITLKGAPWCDWKVNSDGGNEDTGNVDFHICDGADGTGDLYNIANIDCFRDTLHARYPKGAHLVVADGGFPDARDQSNQELIMTRLVFAETLTMFGVLQIGGSFLCKTFELSSTLMLQLFWLLHNCFDEITIVKPVTSRPASSERYIVAHTLLPDLPLQAIQQELSRLVASLGSKDPQHESLQLMDAFPISPKTWLEIVAQASDRHAKQQIQACERIIALASPPSPQCRDHRPTLRIDSEEYYRAWGL